MADDEKGIEWTGFMADESTIADIAKMIVERVAEESENGTRKIRSTGFVVGWSDGTFSHYATTKGTPEELKHLADLLYSAGEYWFNAWKLTQDEDDYGNDDLYVS